jgi:hypothetical protein
LTPGFTKGAGKPPEAGDFSVLQAGDGAVNESESNLFNRLRGD